MAYRYTTFIIITLLLVIQQCVRSEQRCLSGDGQRFLLYSLNKHEGFNLRRDSFYRIATSLAKSNQSWTIVLPPWRAIQHWNDGNNWDDDNQGRPWSDFFDISSWNHSVDLIEFKDFSRGFSGHVPVDTLVHIRGSRLTIEQMNDEQFLKSMGVRWSIDPLSTCLGEGVEHDFQLHISPSSDSLSHPYRVHIQEYKEVNAKRIWCANVFSDCSALTQFLDILSGRIILLARAETFFWGPEYFNGERDATWKRLFPSPALIHAAERFARRTLDPQLLQLVHAKNITWKTDRSASLLLLSSASPIRPGNYIAAHIRRNDFRWAHASTFLELSEVAHRLKEIQQRHSLPNKLFIASDMSEDEWTELRRYLDFERFPVGRRKENNNNNNNKITKKKKEEKDSNWGSGQRTMIEQWICARAAYFVASANSFVSLTISEERRLRLGQPDSTTFKLSE